MSAAKTEDVNVSNKLLVQRMCAQDGGLVAPIDLTMDIPTPLQLERLQWFNFYDVPSTMKMGNNGTSLFISAKWAKERPYLTGGPLDDNYVFSQIHFHWGSSDNEGSEHTVRGISYPLEMHVVFFKTRYLTQAAALKHNDGLIILAYLFKLQSHSAPGLHWLARQLENVVEPLTSTLMSPMPLAAIMVPFDANYITYWGALVGENCKHPVLWFLSRNALAVTSDDLNMFRALLDSKRKAMTKNFRPTNPSRGRAVFHVNPSSDKINLLLPETVDPPCRAVVVGCSLTPPTDQTGTEKILSKGDTNEYEVKKVEERNIEKERLKNGKTRFCHEGNTRDRSLKFEKTTNNQHKPGGETKLQRQCLSSKNTSKEKGKKSNKAGFQDQKENCVNKNKATSFSLTSSKFTQDSQITADNTDNGKILNKIKENKEKYEKLSKKSEAPVPKGKTRKGKSDLQSSYASYFNNRPDSAPIEPAKSETTDILCELLTSDRTKIIASPTPVSGMKRKTAIPRPVTRHGVK